jgi:hypothetical protein
MWRINPFFFAQTETVFHLFFECVVIKQIWGFFSDLFGVQLGQDFESVAMWWISNNKNSVLNVFCDAALWSI